MSLRFIMDGETFDPTVEQVRSCLAGKLSGNIQEHRVEVEGQHWPVKQALSIVTGARKSRFVSTTVRRHVHNVGFVVSGDSEPQTTVTTSSPRTTRQPLDPATLPERETVTASVSFTWRKTGQVMLDHDGLPGSHRSGDYQASTVSTSGFATPMARTGCTSGSR